VYVLVGMCSWHTIEINGGRKNNIMLRNFVSFVRIILFSVVERNIVMKCNKQIESLKRFSRFSQHAFALLWFEVRKICLIIAWMKCAFGRHQPVGVLLRRTVYQRVIPCQLDKSMSQWTGNFKMGILMDFTSNSKKKSQLTFFSKYVFALIKHEKNTNLFRLFRAPATENRNLYQICTLGRVWELEKNHYSTQKTMSQILRFWYVESMKIVILYRRMSFCFDSTTLIIDFTSLVYFI
jgi:hypothetical protein